MTSRTLARQRTEPAPSPLLQIVAALFLGVFLFFLLLAGTAAAFESYFAGQVFPGIKVAGLDVSGMAPEEAAARLEEWIRFPETGKIAFQDGNQTWAASPTELGLYLDPQASAQAAYNLGRQGNPVARALAQLEAWYFGQDLSPRLVYDERVAQAYLAGLAAGINKPVVDASLALEGGSVQERPGQIGRTVDLAATLVPLESQLRSLTDGLLPLVVEETQPAILDVSEAAEAARNILSGQLILTVPEPAEGDPEPWTLTVEQIAALLKIDRVEDAQGARYEVGLDGEKLRRFVEGLAPNLARSPADARFIFNDETRQLEVIQPSVTGRSLDVETTLQAIQTGLTEGQHSISLAVVTQQPEVSGDMTAEQLGIKELVSSQTTYFYGSSQARIQNITTAASRFHGVLVAPGETFSMAETMGDVSLDTGYAEALIIYGDRSIQGVGGGVCQVSTTLFRTVFFGGYPVVERYSHAYRVYYYELNAANQVNEDMAGLDATVYVPVVDFKFTNDTPHWLLMETYVNAAARTITWKFYSTSDGRSVEWDTTGLQNVVEPEEPVYTENPDLDKGEINQVDWEVAGADVTVTRTVHRNGEVYLQDDFSTHYAPWRSVYEYGPGTRVPEEESRESE